MVTSANSAEIKEMTVERYEKLKENSLKIEGNWTFPLPVSFEIFQGKSGKTE